MPIPRAQADDLARKLGARIRALRDDAGITQERLAWDTDLSKQFLSQIEAGRRLPSLAVCAALAERLGCELVDVVAFDRRSARVRFLDATRRGDRDAGERALRAMGFRPPSSRSHAGD